MSVPTRIILRGMFGKPTLQWLKNNGTESNGRAEWSREWRRYGQWTAKLSPGVQTDDDYGSVSWDVNGMRLADLEQISYVYRMGATELVAPNVAIHVYDPNDIDNRADITLSHSTVGLGVTSGWQKYDLTTTIDGCFYYGNNIPSTVGLTSSDGTSATIYTLAEFQADPVFKNYVIGKLTIEYGYYSTGFLSPAHICKVEVIHDGKRVDLELEPSVEEQLNIFMDDQAKALTTIPTWTFGAPTLRQSNAGQASWSRYQYQKGGTGWNAKLEGGIQSGDDWASMFVPVNEIPLSELNTILWSYHKAGSVQSGVALEIWAHDPTDFSKRAEIGQTMGAVGYTAGWQSEELDTSASEFKWWGENVGSPDTCATTNTDYTWAQYQSDSVFSTWTIYRIEFVIGWVGAGTLLPAHLAEVVINGTAIPLGPKNGKSSVNAVHARSIAGGAAGALDVVSNATASSGTAWTWDMGASGYITKGIITIATTSLTSRLALFLFTVTPTGELDDNDPNNSPLVADIPYFVGVIDFPALVDRAAGGPSYTIATPSTVGNLPLAYKGPVLYGILVNLDAATLGNAVCSIHLFADIQEDN